MDEIVLIGSRAEGMGNKGDSTESDASHIERSRDRMGCGWELTSLRLSLGAKNVDWGGGVVWMGEALALQTDKTIFQGVGGGGRHDKAGMPVVKMAGAVETVAMSIG